MTVWYDKKRKGYRFKFQYLGRPYQSPRAFTRKGDALDAERALRIRVERAAAGLDTTPTKGHAPRFSEWAGVYWQWVLEQHAIGEIKRPERIREQLTVVLRFWGARPSTKDTTRADEDAPFHDLRLDDPILDPTWLRRWDAWVTARGVANDTRNHYTSTLSRLYWFALLVENRSTTGIEFNPFADRPRPSGRRRTVTLTPEDVPKILEQASYHVRLALTIGALALALRLRNILELRFDQHIDPDFTRIIVWKHKTDRVNGGKPLVVDITTELGLVLLDAQQRSRAGYVVEYRGQPIGRLEGGLRGACEAAGIAYGQAHGITFHTIRHSVVTWLGKKKIAPKHIQQATQHEQLSSVLWYMHLGSEEARAALEAVAELLPTVVDITTQPWRRAKRQKAAPANRRHSGIDSSSPSPAPAKLLTE